MKRSSTEFRFAANILFDVGVLIHDNGGFNRALLLDRNHRCVVTFDHLSFPPSKAFQTRKVNKCYCCGARHAF
jgi:hypothetical protein